MAASRFHDGQRGATHFVRPFVFGRELRIIGPDDATLAVWKLDQIDVAPEVDPDGAIAFTARDSPGVLLVEERAELEMLRGAGLKLPGQRTWTRGHFVAMSAGLIGVLAAGVLALNTLPHWIADIIPISWEQKLGAPAETLMTASTARCKGEEGQAALEALVARLRRAGSIRMPVTITVLDDRLVNAFTLPGGHVLLMRGLIADARDGPMLAGVIAHELGHVTHRDSTTLMLRAMGFSVLLHLLGLGDTGGTAAAGASNLMSLAYSRAAEAAADETAISLLTTSGLRADGLSRFFAGLEHAGGGHAGPAEADKSARGKAGSTFGWFATHPPSAERRERTARAETGEMPFTDAEWQAIKGMCARK